MTLPWYIVAALLCVALSAFFSAAEMAFASANRIRLENAMEAGSKKAAVACAICRRYDDALSAILIGNNFVNIAASSLASIIAISLVGERYTAVFVTAITVLIILFGETLPKIVAKKNANRLALSFSYAVRFLVFILKPIVFVTTRAVRLILRLNKDNGEKADQEAAIEELQSIIETVEDEGVIDEERSELLQAALDFSEISASEIMTSRVDMVAIDISDDWDSILATIEDAPYSRIPVYDGSIDNIIGILYLNHFFKSLIDNKEVDIRGLLMDACYVYKTLKLPSVLGELRRAKMHMAIVTDEYGGSMGIVTMEDVLEQIVGDIWDETDEITPEILESAPGVFEIDGDMSISDFLELLEWDKGSFETDSSTVGGWTIEMFGAFPTVSQSFDYENLTVTVLAMDNLRARRLRVQINEPDERSE